MKIAILIQCHKNPKQINLLLERLNHPDIDCYLHIDKKADFKITDDSFRSITLVDGNCTLKMDECELELKKGDTVFIPAQNADYTVCGKCSFILSYV